MAPIPQKTARPRFLKTTSVETWVFLALLLLISLAGFNSGNNLLYLISGVMLGSVLISLVAGRVNLSRLAVRRRLPPRAFAGYPFKMRLELANNKRAYKSFAVSLEEKAGEQRSSFFVSIKNGGKQVREMEVLLDRRGLYRFPPIVLRSNFPFGLFNMKKEASDPKEIIVYPRIFDINKAVGGWSRIRDEFPRHQKGPGSGLYGFREYRHGEEAANISWKLSAKLGTLIVRETEHEEKRRVCIVFDNALRENSEAAAEAFEQAVSNAASLVWYLCGNGYSIKLVTRNKVTGYGVGPEHMHRMLGVLALIEAVEVGEDVPIADRSALEGASGVLVTCAGEAGTVRARVGGFAAVIAGRIGAEGT